MGGPQSPGHRQDCIGPQSQGLSSMRVEKGKRTRLTHLGGCQAPCWEVPSVPPCWELPMRGAFTLLRSIFGHLVRDAPPRSPPYLLREGPVSLSPNPTGLERRGRGPGTRWEVRRPVVARCFCLSHWEGTSLITCPRLLFPPGPHRPHVTRPPRWCTRYPPPPGLQFDLLPVSFVPLPRSKLPAAHFLPTRSELWKGDRRGAEGRHPGKGRADTAS